MTRDGARRRGGIFGIFSLLGSLGVGLIGCPIYSSDCDSSRDCARGFRCDSYSKRCEAVVEFIGCARPEDCASAETCTPDYECLPGSCDYHGCLPGYRCGIVDSAHACVPLIGDAGPDVGDSATPEPSDAGADSAVVVSPPDASEPSPADASTADADTGL